MKFLQELEEMLADIFTEDC